MWGHKWAAEKKKPGARAGLSCGGRVMHGRSSAPLSRIAVLHSLQFFDRLLMRLLCADIEALGALKQLAVLTDFPAKAAGLGLDLDRVRVWN